MPKATLSEHAADHQGYRRYGADFRQMLSPDSRATASSALSAPAAALSSTPSHCKNIADFRHRPDKWIDVQWEARLKGEFTAEFRVEVANQRGVLATVASAIADMGS